VVVAEILSIRKHPNADRLSFVEVKTHQGTLPIVCGATILKKVRKSLSLGRPRLPNGLEIKKSKIRGVSSEGMLCSETELALGQDTSGIMILPPQTPTGVDLGEALV